MPDAWLAKTQPTVVGGAGGAVQSDVVDIPLQSIDQQFDADPVVVLTTDQPAASDTTSGGDTSAPAASRPRRLVWFAAAAVVAIALVWLGGRDTASGPVAGSTGDDGSRNVIDNAGDGDAVEDLGPFDRNEPFAEPEIVDAQSAALADLIGTNRLAYVARDGVVIVDLEAGTAPVAEFEPESFDQFEDLSKLSGFELLSDGDSTFGIAKDDDITVHGFSNSGRLVPTADDGVFSVTSDPAEEWERLFVATSAGFFMADLDVPRGSTYLNIAGLGTLVSPPTGGTFLAGIEGYERFSDNRVVAATPSHQVEIRCQGFTCNPVHLERSSGDYQQVPDDFAGDDGLVSISPDGRWILRTDSADDVAFDTETGGFHRLDTRQKGPVVWAPDSSFAVWFDPLTTGPVLQVLYPELRTSETLDLSELGAADRVGSELLVFS